MKRRRFMSVVLSLCLLFGVCTGSALSAAAAGDETMEIVSYPSSELFDQLWVGDRIDFDAGTGSYDLEVTVTEGQDKVSYDDWDRMLSCDAAGAAQVKATLKSKDGAVLDEQTYTLTVSERPAEVTAYNYTSDITCKLGDSEKEMFEAIQWKVENLNYAENSWNFFYIGDNALDMRYGFEEVRMSALLRTDSTRVAVNTDLPEEELDYLTKMVFNAPGTVELQLYCEPYPWQQEVDNTQIGSPVVLTVEEPVITVMVNDEKMNPAGVRNVTAGDSVSFSTELTNTALKNLKVAHYEDKSNYDEGGIYSGEENLLAYKPTVKIIKGQEFVSQSNQDYSNTLSSEETLTFNGDGLVEVEITYNQIDTLDRKEAGDDTKFYSPKQTYIFQVIDPALEKDSSATINADPGVTIEDDSAFPDGTVVTVKSEKTGKLFEQAKAALKNLFEKFNAFSIEAIRNGVTVQPNGKVKVVFDIPKEFSSNVAVYYIDDNGKIEKIKTTVDAKSRTAAAELEHFSLYALVDEGSKVPPTGDGFSLGWLLLAAGIGLGGAGLTVFLKKKSKAE